MMEGGKTLQRTQILVLGKILPPIDMIYKIDVAPSLLSGKNDYLQYVHTHSMFKYIVL